MDLNGQAVAYAKTHRHVNAVCGNLTDLHFPEGSFDLVTLWNVLDHTPDPVEFLAEIHRVLKEDGYIFIRTPNAVLQYLSFRLAFPLLRLGLKTFFEKRPFATFVFHNSSFSRSTLRLLMEEAGFDTVSIRNSKPTQGDPYLGLGSRAERLLTLTKLTVHGVAQSVYLVSGGRWVIGPSLDAWGRKGKLHGPA